MYCMVENNQTMYDYENTTWNIYSGGLWLVVLLININDSTLTSIQVDVQCPVNTKYKLS